MTTVTTEPARPSLPRISIVTPSYNQAQFLEQTIRSVLDQGYPNLEYIIMDGGSVDGSVDIIKRYASKLHYWQSQPDGGQYHAIASGFEHASGEILAWINSDDLYMPGALHRVASVFSTFPEVHWISTLQQIILNKAGDRAQENPIPGFARDAFLDGLYSRPKRYQLGFIQQESTFWTRSIWERSGGLNTGIDLAGDFDLWCRFYRLEDLYGVAATIAGFRQHDSNRSLTIQEYMVEAMQSLDELRKDLGWDGHSRTFRVLDKLYDNNPLPRGYRLIRHKLFASYRSTNICRQSNGETGCWIKKNARF